MERLSLAKLATVVKNKAMWALSMAMKRTVGLSGVVDDEDTEGHSRGKEPMLGNDFTENNDRFWYRLDALLMAEEAQRADDGKHRHGEGKKDQKEKNQVRAGFLFVQLRHYSAFSVSPAVMN